MKKVIRSFVVSGVFLVTILSSAIKVSAAPYLLYEKFSKEEISKGVSYSEINQVTSEGLRDIFVLKLPANDPNIKLNNTFSKKDFNLKETTSNLLNSKGAIAGVNGDFFVMNGDYSIAQGPTVVDGKLISTDRMNNSEKNLYASFFLTKDGFPFIDYVKTEIKFLNNGEENVKIQYMNKVPNMIYPLYVDGTAMSDTSPIDDKYSGIVKVVVSDNKIVKISEKGENVKMPDDGYIIAMSSESADYFTTLMQVGDTAEISVNSKVDYESLQTAIGGGAKILQNGEYIKDGGFAPSGRNPRTAIGYSKDKKEIFIVVVDGRSHSIGATHEEMASILTRLGVNDAMHFDGGGSSTMSIKTINEDYVKAVNTPSQGAERKVINALGVYNESEKGNLSSLKIVLRSDKIIQGIGTPYEIFGLDEYLNKIEIDSNSINLKASEDSGVFKNGMFYPSKSGKIKISASLNGIEGEVSVESLKLAEIISEQNNIQLSLGEKIELGFNGKSVDGISKYIYDGLEYEIVPNTLGNIENNTFTAKENGVGYIKVSVLDVVYYIDVSVGFKSSLITSFEESQAVNYTSYPENILGSSYISESNVFDGTKAIEFNYKFEKTDITQASYLTFEEKIHLKNNPKKIKLSVFGDESKNWLRGKILDSENKEFTIDFAKEINWTGYKEVEAIIPSNVKYPIFLDKIYVVSPENSNTKQFTLFFDKLVSIYHDGEKLEHAKNTTFYDLLRAELKSINITNSFDITAIGDIYSEKAKKEDYYSDAQNTVINSFIKNSQKGLFVGETDYPNELDISTMLWGKYYAFYEINNVGVVYMTSNKGNLYNSNLEQWEKFYDDIAQRDKKHIIIETDISPLNLNSVKEFDLFHGALQELKETGKNIFVVSTEGTSSSTIVKDGIRYINLGGLFKKDNSINNDFRVLRFKISNDEIYYDLEKVFD